MSEPDVRTSSDRSEENANPDVTKTLWYAISDLVIKLVSAAAIVALGIAGWRLQQRDRETKKADDSAKQAIDQREREQRRYLPSLRSIAEVDLALVETSAEYAWPTYTKGEAGRESRLGTHLAYLAASLSFPDKEPKLDVVTALDNATGVTNPHIVAIPARSAVLMLAEVMRLAPFLRKWDRPGALVHVETGGLFVNDKHGKFLDGIGLDPRTVGAFSEWLPLDGMPVYDLVHDVDLTTLADELNEQLTAIADNEVKRNPDVLAQAYVTIRNEVLRARADLVPK